jgi:predicted ATPase
LFSVLFRIWVTNLVAFKGEVLRELAAQFLALAEKQGALVPLMVGHRIMGNTLASIGDFAGALAHHDQSLALYHPAEHRLPAMRFGQDHRMTVLCWRALALWVLGYPEKAVADTDHALKDAREIGQAATLMHALTLTSIPHILCGNYATANALLDELVILADGKGAFFWKATGMLLQGFLLALTGKAADAVQMIASGITARQSTRATQWTSLHLSYLARAYAELGQFDDAWRCIGEAMTAAETTKERWYEAEVHRMAGEIALKSPEPDAARAEVYFDRALAVVRAQQAKSSELARRQVWRGSGAIRVNGSGLTIFALRSMVGSPKASTRLT